MESEISMAAKLGWRGSTRTVRFRWSWRSVALACLSIALFAIPSSSASLLTTSERVSILPLNTYSVGGLAHFDFHKSLDVARFDSSLSQIPLGEFLFDFQIASVDVPWWYRVGFGAMFLLEAALIVGLMVERIWRKSAKRKIHERLGFGELICHISDHLGQCLPGEVDQKIDLALKPILEFYRQDRCWLMEVDDGGEARILHACYSPGVPTARKKFNLAQLFPWTFDQVIRNGKCVSFRSSDELPPGLERDRNAWIAAGVRSSLYIPLSMKEKLRYVLVMESTRQAYLWTKESINQLRLIGEFFARAMERRDADHALRQSEALFCDLADNTPVLIWSAGPDKRCFYFNKPWLNFVGRSLGEELAYGWAGNVHPDRRQSCLVDYSIAFDARREFKFEWQLRRFDGAYRLVSGQCKPRFDSEGQFLGYIGSCIDITDLKVAERSLRDMGGRLIEAQEEERSRIARELHDDISQRMALLLIDLDRMRYHLPNGAAHSTLLLREIIDSANGISSDIHNLSHQLHPSKLEILGLVAAIKGYCRELTAQQDLQIKFTHGEDPRNLSKDIMLCLYRIVQEALHNVVKHSGARQATVDLKFYPDEIYLCVSDFGEGFDVELANDGQGLGMVSMRERLRLVNGQLSVRSAPSTGTKIEAWIPIIEFGHRPTSDLRMTGSEAYL